MIRFAFIQPIHLLPLLMVGIAIESVTASRVPAGQPESPFNNRSLAAWTTGGGKPVNSGWEVGEGITHLKLDKNRAGSIVTANDYEDFSLAFDWKIAPGGNSGIKYRVQKYGNKVLGCEYQIYDDSKKKPAPNKSAGALYDLYEPNSSKRLNAAGEWNSAKIVVRDSRIEHWLNGQQIVSATIGDAEWSKRVAESKFDDVVDFSQNSRGKFMLTDHGSEVWFRNFELEFYDAK